MLRDNRAETVRRGSRVAPLRCTSVGATNRSYVTMHDTGLPGSPNTALPAHTPRIVGLPGLSETPCTRTPGSPRLSITCAVMSRLLTELPAERITTSFSLRAFSATAFKDSYTSGTSPARHGR